MISKLKAVVAAVALAAVAGQASANIANPGVGAPGELVFWAYGQDALGNYATYAKDLGVTYDAFVSSPSFALTDLGLDSNWNSFINNASLVGNKGWVVTALATQGGTGLNSRKILTTFTGDNFGAGVTNGPMTNAYGNFSTGVAAINVTDGSANGVNNSYYFDTSTNGTDKNLGWKLTNDYGMSGTFPAAANIVGTTTTANFYSVIKTSSNSGLAATITDIDASTAYWTLSGNNLSYGTVAAVPEPETYGMLAAGLLMLGAVARRRRG